MFKKIHREMAYKVISDFPNKSALEFLTKGIAKKEWDINKKQKPRWVKDWMDMPDSNKHSSKQKNDHSYKIRKKTNGYFKIVFPEKSCDNSTVVARLKYAARSVKEWKVEEEYRACALELAKSFHWIVDFSTPPHSAYGWDSNLHSKLERDFDNNWKILFEKIQIKYNRKNHIKDIYYWAKNQIEYNYHRNMELLEIYKNKGSIKKGRGAELGKEIIQNVAQNIVDYLYYTDSKINFESVCKKLP